MSTSTLDSILPIPKDYAPESDEPHIVAVEITRLMSGIAGRLELSTTSLFVLLNQRASESTRAHEKWPPDVTALAIAIKKWCRSDLAANGITVKSQRREGKNRLVITKSE